jgi:hypothetical protein
MNRPANMFDGGLISWRYYVSDFLNELLLNAIGIEEIEFNERVDIPNGAIPPEVIVCRFLITLFIPMKIVRMLDKKPLAVFPIPPVMETPSLSTVLSVAWKTR